MSSALVWDSRSGSGARSVDHANRLLAAMMVVAIGLLVAVDITVVSTVYAAEFALLAVLPFTLVAKRELDPRILLLLLLGVGWLWSQVVTDIIRDSSFDDYARGWARIAFALVNLVALWFLVGGRLQRQLFFAAGLAGGFALRFALDPSQLAEGDPWKFGLAVPVTLGMTIMASTTVAQATWFVQPALLGFASFVNMMLGFRSLAGVCFLAAVLLILRPKGAGGVRLTPIAVVLVAAVAAVAFFIGYQRAAKDGLLGPAAAVKFESQARGDLGILLVGRPETYPSILAIRDSPFIGHGSWPSDPQYRLAMAAELRSGGYLVYEAADTDLIPTHSYLLGAWVEAGIIGAVFWVAVLALCISALLAIQRSLSAFAPLAAFLGFWLTWDVLFSPFGTDRRIIAPFAIVVLVSALRDAHAGSSQSRASSPAGGGA
jgi:hypothetical protein